jgi:hypothetical protein
VQTPVPPPSSPQYVSVSYFAQGGGRVGPGGGGESGVEGEGTGAGVGEGGE